MDLSTSQILHNLTVCSMSPKCPCVRCLACPFGQNPLHMIKRDDPELVRILVAEFDPNHRDLQMMTPLHYACGVGLPMVVHALIGNGAKCYLDAAGYTPLHYANRNTDIVRYLLGIGYDYTIKGKDGLMCEDIASVEVIRIIEAFRRKHGKEEVKFVPVEDGLTELEGWDGSDMDSDSGNKETKDHGENKDLLSRVENKPASSRECGLNQKNLPSHPKWDWSGNPSPTIPDPPRVSLDLTKNSTECIINIKNDVTMPDLIPSRSTPDPMDLVDNVVMISSQEYNKEWAVNIRVPSPTKMFRSNHCLPLYVVSDLELWSGGMYPEP